jgi:hypothetical protein
MSLLQRFPGVFIAPTSTMNAVAERPKGRGALILVLVAVAVFAYIAAPYGAQDQLKMMKDNVKMKDRLGEDRYNEAIAALEHPSPARTAVMSFVGAPVIQAIGFLLGAVVILIIGRLVSTQGAFAPVFAVIVHANFIDKILGGAVRTLLYTLRGSVMEASTSLALLAPKAEITSTSYILLSQIDFFQIWMYGVIGLGLAAVFKITVKKGLAVAFSFWAVKTAIFVAFGFLFRSFLA